MRSGKTIFHRLFVAFPYETVVHRRCNLPHPISNGKIFTTAILSKMQETNSYNGCLRQKKNNKKGNEREKPTKKINLL